MGESDDGSGSLTSSGGGNTPEKMCYVTKMRYTRKDKWKIQRRLIYQPWTWSQNRKQHCLNRYSTALCPNIDKSQQQHRDDRGG